MLNAKAKDELLRLIICKDVIVNDNGNKTRETHYGE